MSEVKIDIADGVTLNEDGSITVELTEPIYRASTKERIEAVTLKRPKVKDIVDVDTRKLDEGDLTQAMKLISTLGGLTMEEVGELGVGDFTLLSAQTPRLFQRVSASKKRL